jgi:L-asparaginase/beta-aspartyl-peptidase (threonine type)
MRTVGTVVAEAEERGGLAGAGTVGAVALDRSGHVAAATSTGGRSGQPPGRVGDSAIIGAGTWADDKTVAVSATGAGGAVIHAGEAFILAGFSHQVNWLVRQGVELDNALAIALQAVRARGGSGGAIALSTAGRFALIFDTPAMARGFRGHDSLVVQI